MKKKLVTIVCILLVLLVSVFAGTVKTFGKSKSDYTKYQLDYTIYTKDGGVQSLDNTNLQIKQGEVKTIAFFGVDNRSNGNLDEGNSDVIMICKLDTTTNSIKLVSIYRDTSLVMDGKKQIRKVNYAYNHGGPEKAIEVLNSNLDLNITDYVTVDFLALADVIDSLGGIELEPTDEEVGYINEYNNETAFVTNKEHVDLTTSGKQVVNGVNAVAYCRIRYTEGGDFKRAERQRTVLNAVLSKVKTASVTDLKKILTSTFDEISTSLSLSDIIELLPYVKNFSIDGMNAFPFELNTKNYQGSYGWLDVPCSLESNVTKLHRYLYDEINYTPSKTVTDYSNTIIKFSGFDTTDATVVQY